MTVHHVSFICTGKHLHSTEKFKLIFITVESSLFLGGYLWVPLPTNLRTSKILTIHETLTPTKMYDSTVFELIFDSLIFFIQSIRNNPK